MEGGEAGGLRFLLQFDPARPGLDRALLGFSFSALFSRLVVGWSKHGQTGGGGGGGFPAIAAEGEGGEGSGNAAVSVAALAAAAAAASLCLAAMYASDQRRPRHARARRLPALASAPRSRALHAPHDGLRILSSDDPNDESPDKVIHGASIGAGDDEPDIVARVEMDSTPPAVPVPNAAAAAADDDETETEAEEEEEEERQELQRLRELWLSLEEREQRLELRLQELEGLRSQEAAARELETRAAAADAEVRILQLSVSALQEENGRLRARAEDLDAARAELARAKEKLRAVKARVQGEQEAAAAALRRKVEELESGGRERVGALVAEVAELRKANAALEADNMELALRLQDAEQQAASGASASNLAPEEGMIQEMTYLRESNERLTRQIEQLHNDHCAHVEDLVYLKWVNACLRHELRDHDGQPTAEQQGPSAGSRDLSALELSKSMSFRSSERAKQLMLRYGSPGLDRFDPALFSPLHESVDGDGYGYERSPAHSYEPERSPCARPGGTATASSSPAAAPGKKAGPRRLKLLGNIKKLLPAVGKRSHSNHGHGHAGHDGRKAPAPAPARRDEYLEKAMQWLSAHDVLDGDHSYVSTPLSSCERTPLSSATTSTTADSRARCGDGGGGRSERGEATRPEAEPTLARSKSDAGGAYGREASRYHALRPEHPGREADEPDGFRAPEKREARRQSAEELRTPAVA